MMRRLMVWQVFIGVFCCGLVAGPALSQGAQAGSPSARIDVWLDVDTANGVGDVDDGLMMIQAFHSSELNVRGVSVQFGNAELGPAVQIAEDIVAKFGPPGMPVHAGAASADDLGKDTEAVQAMAAALREAPMHILAVGPVTNAATLLQRHPELAPRIESLVLVAARRPGQRFVVRDGQKTPFRDANFEKDVPAMRVLLDSGVPPVFAPWEVSADVYLTAADLEALREQGGPGSSGAWIAETSQYWYDRWKDNLGTDGFTPFDTLAVGWLTHPQLIEAMPVVAALETGPDDGAKPVAPRQPGEPKPYLHVRAASPADANAIYTYRALPGFHGVLMERLAGPPSSQDERTGDTP